MSEKKKRRGLRAVPDTGQKPKPVPPPAAEKAERPIPSVGEIEDEVTRVGASLGRNPDNTKAPGLIAFLGIIVFFIVALVATGCDNLLGRDDDGPGGLCCPASALSALPDGTFHDCGFATPAPGVTCPPSGVAGSECFAGQCALVGVNSVDPPSLLENDAGDLTACCCDGADGPAGAWCDANALAGGCVARPTGNNQTCGELLP